MTALDMKNDRLGPYALGTVIPDGMTDIDKILDAAGLNWGIELVPSTYEWGGETRVNKHMFTPVRTDTGVGLGAVGSRYGVLDNRQAFEVLQGFVAKGELTVEAAAPLNGGRKVAMFTKIPGNVVVDPGGIGDEIERFVAVFNSHNGTGALKLMDTPVRPWCANMEGVATSRANRVFSVRHTSSIHQRIAEVAAALQESLGYYEEWAKESTVLARAKMSVGEFDRFLDTFWDVTEDSSAHKKTRHETRKGHLHRLFGDSDTTENCRGTAYAARCAMTEYYDFIAPERPRKDELTGLTVRTGRAQRAIEGGLDAHKSRAHRELLQLVRR